MGDVRVVRTIEAPISAVWAELADIASHVDWMADARRIDFLSETRSGVGTAFECLTVVGPLRLRDRMEITRWQEPVAVSVRHDGLVTGEGGFTLTELGPGRTDLQWAETFRYPLGRLGALAGVVGNRVLARIWTGNLRRLAERIES